MNEPAQQPLLREQISTDATDRSSTYTKRNRAYVRRLLNSKYGHYSVLLLVSLDVSCIFADFIISLYRCEHGCLRDKVDGCEDLATTQDALEVVSLVFSCLFMVELIASLWAYGLSFFKSKFRCFDALVILVSFVIDVGLKGVIEEVGSIVVVLRLWRVIKIIEELGAGAADQMSELQEKVETLTEENAELKRDLSRYRNNAV